MELGLISQRNRNTAGIVVLACALGALSGTAYGSENVVPMNVSVGGQRITRNDFATLTKGMLTAHIHQLVKDPSSMPKDAPLVYFAGNHAIWVSKAVHQDLGGFARVSAKDQPAEDAFVAAVALAAMDAGAAGSPWNGIYHRTPANRAARLALGKEVTRAMKRGE